MKRLAYAHRARIRSPAIVLETTTASHVRHGDNPRHPASVSGWDPLTSLRVEVHEGPGHRGTVRVKGQTMQSEAFWKGTDPAQTTTV